MGRGEESGNPGEKEVVGGGGGGGGYRRQEKKTRGRSSTRVGIGGYTWRLPNNA